MDRVVYLTGKLVPSYSWEIAHNELVMLIEMKLYYSLIQPSKGVCSVV